MPLTQAWELWQLCLKGNDENSIFQQIYRMVWDAAIFRLILKSRQITATENPENPPINGHLHSFIDRCFFYSQAASIRRVIDPRSGLVGVRGVYSLGALINDISNRRSDLTRELFFQLRLLPYDYSKIQDAEREFVLQQVSKSDEGFMVPPEYDWELIKDAHVTFDRLSNTNPQDRKPSDIIHERVLPLLLKRVESCIAIARHVDKYVAHSATPESRFSENVKDKQITFKHIWDAHQAIYEVAEFLSSALFSESHVPLAWESPFLYQYWDSPLLDHNQIPMLQETFMDFRKETDCWRLDGVERLWQSIKGK